MIVLLTLSTLILGYLSLISFKMVEKLDNENQELRNILKKYDEES